MGTTSPDGIGYPDVSYAGGVRLAVKDNADTTQTALLARQGRTFRVANSAALTALASSYTLRADDHAYQIDTGVSYRHNGTAWSALTTRYQLDTTNTAIISVTQIGIGKIIGNGTTSVSEAVTFPVAFKTGTIPAVVANYLGNRATGAFNAAGLTPSGGIATGSGGPSATGVTVGMTLPSGSFSASFDYYYSWIAIGEVA
jgi:hypothetical protein